MNEQIQKSPHPSGGEFVKGDAPKNQGNEPHESESSLPLFSLAVHPGKIILKKLIGVFMGGLSGLVISIVIPFPFHVSYDKLYNECFWIFLGSIVGASFNGGWVGKIGWSMLTGSFGAILFETYFSPNLGNQGRLLLGPFVGLAIGFLIGAVWEIADYQKSSGS